MDSGIVQIAYKTVSVNNENKILKCIPSSFVPELERAAAAYLGKASQIRSKKRGMDSDYVQIVQTTFSVRRLKSMPCSFVPDLEHVAAVSLGHSSQRRKDASRMDGGYVHIA